MSNKVGDANAPAGEGKQPPAGTFQPGTAMNATSSIEISISCRELANMDVLSKSDPMCVVYIRPMNSKKWVELLRTEVLDNNLNPDFATKLQMEYRFEQAQTLRFEVYDIDNPDCILDDQDSIGFVECTVANIVSAGAKGFKQELDSYEPGAMRGMIILVAEELASLKDEVHLRMCGNGFGSCMTCFMPNTLYALSKINDAGNYLVVFRSKTIRGSNPIYPTLTISGRSLCGGDKDRQLKMECYRKNLKGEDELVGYCFTTLNRMANGMDDRLQLNGRNGQAIHSAFSIMSCQITPVFTFLDYVQAGTRLHLVFSIDFTSSNGDPGHPSSLHHVSPDPHITNAYEQAIIAVGTVIKDYDNTGIFPVYGFGARVPPIGETSHLFPVTLGKSPNCAGIDGVLSAYKSCISRVQLFGPTNMAPVINRVINIATQTRPGQHYYILVIVTDGVVTDMHHTKEAVIKASSLPISIVIVGVGEADFESMEELDGDGSMVTYMGKQAERDVVQFVEYRNSESWLRRTGETTGYAAGGGAPKPAAPAPAGGGMAGMVTFAQREISALAAQGQLAEEILAEIPEQVTSYMKSKGLEPSMIKQEDSKPEEAFKGAEGPDDSKKSDEPKKGKASTWNVMLLVNKGKKKFRAKSPRIGVHGEGRGGGTVE